MVFVLGLNEPGIFRRSALTSVIKQIQEKYNEGKSVCCLFHSIEFTCLLNRSTSCIRTVWWYSCASMRFKDIPSWFIWTIDDLSFVSGTSRSLR